MKRFLRQGERAERAAQAVVRRQKQAEAAASGARRRQKREAHEDMIARMQDGDRDAIRAWQEMNGVPVMLPGDLAHRRAEEAGEQIALVQELRRHAYHQAVEDNRLMSEQRRAARQIAQRAVDGPSSGGRPARYPLTCLAVKL